MRSHTSKFIIALATVLIACSKSQTPSPSPSPIPTPVDEVPVEVTVNVSNILRTLTGNEVGLNMNYLMDDAIIPGNNNSKTGEGIIQMGAKILRYPGGEKSDNYYFASPPYSKASPRAITCLLPVKDGNDRFVNADLTAKSIVMDFDEFMATCSQTNAQPLVVVAYDLMYMNDSWCNGVKPTKAQLLENAKQWVKYANVTKNYNVKLWMIGNESFNQNGMSAEQYALDIAEFADAMRSVDPSIKIIANGKSSWWSALLTSPAVSKIDYLAPGNYLGSNMSSYDKYRTNTASLTTETDKAIAAIETLATGTDRSRIGVIVYEYNSIDFNGGWANDNNLGHALCSFQMLADDLVKPKLYSACFWNTRWINNITNSHDLYDALHANGSLNANAISLSILGKNLLSTMVSTTSGNGIKSYASYASGTKDLRIFLLNKELSPKKVKISLANYLASFTYDKWEFKGNNPEDKFPTWATTASNQTGSSNLEITLPATSVTMIACR
ncbi:MAG TPA: hypothetical protein VGB63_00665 [Pedobacter sp.]|jgi:hypothetical protein